MIINKETFEKLALTDQIHFNPVNTGRGYKWIGGTGYLMPSLNNKFRDIRMAFVRQYPDKYSMDINYYDSKQNISLYFNTEDEAYAMLYRFLYMPETINRKDLIKEPTEATEELWISQMSVEEARETRKDLEELDEIILKGDECTKGEKILYRFLSFITKIFLPK